MKTTLKILTSGILFFVLSLSMLAQPNGPNPRQQEKKENIEAMKIAFITQKLELTPEEAQKFWPVYNQYTDKLKELRKKRRQEERDGKQKMDALTDKELEQMIDNDLATRQKELDLQKEYNTKFKAILPIKKVVKLYAAEEQFKMVLLDKLKNKPPIKD
jgi:Spy/CpxP family protein refolding chaperone